MSLGLYERSNYNSNSFTNIASSIVLLNDIIISYKYRKTSLDPDIAKLTECERQEKNDKRIQGVGGSSGY